jgi:hypothetical protein
METPALYFCMVALDFLMIPPTDVPFKGECMDHAASVDSLKTSIFLMLALIM